MAAIPGPRQTAENTMPHHYGYQPTGQQLTLESVWRSLCCAGTLSLRYTVGRATSLPHKLLFWKAIPLDVLNPCSVGLVSISI